MKGFSWLVGLLVLVCADTGYGHETLDAGGAGDGEIGIEEKMGELIPPDLVFRDEKGADVKLGALFGKPAILTLVYYTCEHVCPLMLSGLSQALPRLAVVAGKDYRVITVSFDETDTPEKARDVRKNYIKAAGSAFPEEGWKFLTGDRESIQKLTQSVGFRFRKDIHGFNHPVVLIFLSPEGKISKYLPVTKYQYGAEYPITFSSFDLNVSLAEAAQGKAVTGLKKALLYCFSHEPPGQSKFFNFIAVVGLITLAAMAAFFIYLHVSTRRYRKGGAYDADNN
jgi:protein SCO1/2